MQRTTLLAYGLPGLPLAFGALPVYVHLPDFYARGHGLDLAWLGMLLLVSRLLDAGIDPWLGWLADRLPRRRLLAWSLLPFTVGFVALWHPPPAWAAVWLFLCLLPTYLGFSAATVAYQSWGAAIATDSAQRTRLTAAREGFGLAGIVLAAALPGWLAGQATEGLVALGWLLPLLVVLAAGTALLTIRHEGAPPTPPPAWRPALSRVLADPSMRRLLLVFICNGIASALPATLFLFFVGDVLQAERFSGPLLALYFVAGAASLPGWVWLAGRLGRPRAWLAAMLLAMAAFAGAGLLGAGDVLPFALVCLLSGLALGADLALPAAIAADFGERLGQPGACFGIWNLIAKCNLALAAGLALPLIAAFGYVPGQGGGLGALVGAYVLLPLAGKSLAAALLWRWRHSLEVGS